MIFALICTDKPESLPLRLATRPAHVAWLEGLDRDGRLKLAGPFLGPDGKPMGSMVMITANDIAEAQAVAASDPYAAAGLFQSVDIRPFTWAFKNPEA